MLDVGRRMWDERRHCEEERSDDEAILELEIASPGTTSWRVVALAMTADS